jgi:hypothetical protein
LLQTVPIRSEPIRALLAANGRRQPNSHSLRVLITAMDAVQWAIAFRDTGAAQRPGWRVPEPVRDQDQVVADAHRE